MVWVVSQVSFEISPLWTRWIVNSILFKQAKGYRNESLCLAWYTAVKLSTSNQAIHITGSLNMEAEIMSRAGAHSHEWSIKTTYLELFFTFQGVRVGISLFACEKTRRLWGFSWVGVRIVSLGDVFWLCWQQALFYTSLLSCSLSE